MIKFVDLHQKSVDLLAADAFYAGKTIFKDLGQTLEAEEQHLKDNGFAVAVLPILEGDTDSDAVGITVTTTTVVVLTRCLAGQNIYQYMAENFRILKAFRGKHPADSFWVQGKAWKIDDSDPGLLSAYQFFAKRCVWQ